MRTAIALGLILLVSACAGPAELDERWADPTQIQFASALNVDLASMNLSASGLYWKDLRVGEGDSAKVGDDVRVRLLMWLPDGTLVGDETRQFELVGMGFLLRAMDEGMVGMRVGGIRQLVAPPKLAYGRNGDRNIGVPPLATLVFEIERLTTQARSSRNLQ